MSRIAFPYPTLFPHVRQQGSWEAFIDGNQRLFKDGSGSWDYDSGLDVICRFPWTAESLFEQAELTPLLDNARLALVISTGSSEGTGRRFVATDLAVRDCAECDEGEGTTLRINLESARLCNRIRSSFFVYSTGGEIAGIRLLVEASSTERTPHCSLRGISAASRCDPSPSAPTASETVCGSLIVMPTARKIHLSPRFRCFSTAIDRYSSNNCRARQNRRAFCAGRFALMSWQRC